MYKKDEKKGSAPSLQPTPHDSLAHDDQSLLNKKMNQENANNVDVTNVKAGNVEVDTIKKGVIELDELSKSQNMPNMGPIPDTSTPPGKSDELKGAEDDSEQDNDMKPSPGPVATDDEESKHIYRTPTPKPGRE